MDEVVFSLKEVHYSYLGKFPALCGIDMTVRKGEKIAIIGSNGSGKSTLLNLLDALIFPERGTFAAFGKEMNETLNSEPETARSFRKKVGLVFQNADIQLFCPTVREDIAFGPTQLGMSDEETAERTLWASRLLEIGHLLDRVPHQLSLGEKRRAAIASVLAIDPEVILFDEPTAGLDPLTARHIIDFITIASQKGKTIVTATHDLHIVEEISDTVYVLNRNKTLARSGSPEEILSDMEFLKEHNLVHIHKHTHPGKGHVHPHLPLERHS